MDNFVRVPGSKVHPSSEHTSQSLLRRRTWCAPAPCVLTRPPGPFASTSCAPWQEITSTSHRTCCATSSGAVRLHPDCFAACRATWLRQRWLSTFRIRLLYPDAPFYRRWSMLMSIPMLYTALCTPLFIGLFRESSWPVFLMDRIIDSIFISDLVRSRLLAAASSAADSLQLCGMSASLSQISRHNQGDPLADIVLLCGVPRQDERRCALGCES